MAVSNYGGGQMPGMQVSAPVTPVNEQLISSVGTLGKIAIAQRESENKAVNQQFLSEAQQYFSNVETEIEGDPIRAQALDFAQLSVSSNLNPEQQARLAKYKADFKYLDRAESQGKLSRLNKLTRAQAMLTRALADRPDLGDELRNLATDTLGADVTKASTLLFGEAMAMAKAGETSEDKQLDDMFAGANQLLQYSPDQASSVAFLANARALQAKGDVAGATAELNKFYSQMQSPEGQASIQVAETNAAIDNMTYIVFDGRFQNELLSTDPKISSGAKAKLDGALSQMEKKVEILSSYTGVAAKRAANTLERAKAAVTQLRSYSQYYGNSEAINRRMTNDRTLAESLAPENTKSAIAVLEMDGTAISQKAIQSLSFTSRAVQNLVSNQIGLPRSEYSMPTSGWQFVELFRTEKRGNPDAVRNALDLALDQMEYFHGMVDDRGVPLVLGAQATKAFLDELNLATPNIINQATSALPKGELENLQYQYRAINDRIVYLISKNLPDEYIRDVKVPDSATNGWSVANRRGRYIGKDVEGFGRAWEETARSLGLSDGLQRLRQNADAIHGIQPKSSEGGG